MDIIHTTIEIYLEIAPKIGKKVGIHFYKNILSQINLFLEVLIRYILDLRHGSAFIMSYAFLKKGRFKFTSAKLQLYQYFFHMSVTPTFDSSTGFCHSH